jgi:N-acylneuraminate cytidylyltransferase
MITAKTGKVIAFIPVRGGSKGIPDKNIRELYGKPLIYWTAKAASNCKYFDKIYVSTDSPRIVSVVDSLGLPKVYSIDRDPITATDMASTESAMLDFVGRVDFDHIVLIQATNPLLTTEHLTNGIEKYFNEKADSLLSVIEQKSFLWTNEKPYIRPINYNPLERPRRQDFPGCLVENGAFYITKRQLLLKTKCRISGNISAYIMPIDTYFEIDELEDFLLIEELMRKRYGRNNEMSNNHPD